MVYFAPEAEQKLTETGLRPGRMTYFASRSAPMGEVGPGPVVATFYNFSPDLVARHIPRAWTLASAKDVIEARFAAADAALHTKLGEAVSSPEVAEAAELAREASTYSWPTASTACPRSSPTPSPAVASPSLPPRRRGAGPTNSGRPQSNGCGREGCWTRKPNSPWRQVPSRLVFSPPARSA